MPEILLIDDEEAFVQTLVKRLARRGFTVHTALSGQDGLDALDRLPGVGMVLLDVKMPGLDGIETLKRIKSARPGLAVILLTGHASMESAREGMRHGAFDYLMKPCEMDDLLAKMAEARAGASQPAQGAGG